MMPDELFPVDQPLPPQPKPCFNCGEIECDCDDLRDRRQFLLNSIQGLKKEEHEAKQVVRNIRKEIRDQRTERRELGYSLMTRRSDHLRNQMLDRKGAMKGFERGSEDYRDTRKQYK